MSDRKQFDRVDLATIDFFYRALPEALYSDWLMWREGFSGWRPFSELPLILKHLKKDEEVVQPPPVPDSVLKFADELTSSWRHEVTPQSIVGEAKFELPSEVGQASIEQVDRLTEQVEAGDITHSSVSIRALQAAATSSMRIKTNPNIKAGGAAASLAKPSDKKTEAVSGSSSVPSHSSQEDLQPIGAKVLTLPDEATLSLMLDSQAATEDRNNVRYQKRFKVRIFTPKGIVPMTTIDCSISGFKLKDPLPEGLPRFFHVEIDLGPDGRIPLICSEVKEKDGRPATRVRIQVNDHIQTFKSALMRAS